MKQFTFVIFFVLTWASVGNSPAQQSSDGKVPGFIVAPYMQWSTKSSMTILWETEERSTSRVEYGEALLRAKEPNLLQHQSIEGYRQMHEVELTNLKTESNYFWRVVTQSESGTQWVSPTYSFKTAVNDDAAYMFALIGDTQRNGETPWAWSVISQQVWRKRPNFVVLAGDLVDWGPRKEDWTEHFFPGGQALMARVPIFSVLGNHEADADFYYQYMANPKPEYVYSFQYGNAEFFMIDSNRDLSEGSEQYNWLDQALAKSTATWKIAIHHHPPYSSDSDDHGDSYKALSTLGTHARNLVPLYDQYHVDFCLFGHTHLYERSWPLKNERINQEAGTIYINSGGAGGYIEAFAPTRSWFTLEQWQGHHFCTFSIFDRSLVFKAIDFEGRVFDSFELKKEKPDQVSIIQPPVPIIKSSHYVFHSSTQVQIEPGLRNLDIFYTLDGSEPTSRSMHYKGPIQLEKSATVKARSFSQDGKAGRVHTQAFEKMIPMPAIPLDQKAPGLAYQYFEGDWKSDKDDFFAATHMKDRGQLSSLSFQSFPPDGAPLWGVLVDGYLEVPATDTYTFYATDSRGLEILLDDHPVFGSRGKNQLTRSLVLEKGFHSLHIKSRQQTNRRSFGFGWLHPDLGRIPLRANQLWHIPTTDRLSADADQSRQP